MSNASDVLGASTKVWTAALVVKQWQVVLSPADNGQPYVRVTATGASGTDPSADATNYRPWGGRAIKSIQRFDVAVSAASTNVTIAAVNPYKARLHWLGSLGMNTNGSQAVMPRIYLTNSTTVVVWIFGGTAAPAIPVSFEVIEEY